MPLGTILKRWSHVGRRPITLNELASINVLPAPRGGRVNFGTTHIEQLIQVRGPLGVADIPFYHGLVLRAESGLLSEEKILRVDLNHTAIEAMSKYRKKFVRSMWGTTNSLLRQTIEGVIEVEFGLKLNLISRDIKYP